MTRTLPAALLAAAAFCAPALADDAATQPTTRPAPVEVTLDTADAPTTAQAVPAGSITDQVEPTSVLGGGREFTPATPDNITRVTEKVYPAVVSIEVKQEVYRNGKRELRGGIGSGVIIDQQGHILTNYHVAGRRRRRCTSRSPTRSASPPSSSATTTGPTWPSSSSTWDAVERKGISFVHADLGSSKSLVPGQPVAAIGTPFGLARTLTLGVVSNTERTFYPDKQTIDEYETGEFANWIQMDTPIAPGNSGGPLVDMDAKVIGINTRGAEGYALAFAIPIDTAKPVIRDILETATDNKPGRVGRADLGVDLKPLQDLESFYDIDINRGVLVNSVDRGGPASDAGLRPQDILLSVAGRETNVRFPEEVAPTRNWIADLPLGEPVDVVVKRGGDDLTLSVTPEKAGGGGRSGARAQELGYERARRDARLRERESPRRRHRRGDHDDPPRVPRRQGRAAGRRRDHPRERHADRRPRRLHGRLRRGRGREVRHRPARGPPRPRHADGGAEGDRGE